MTYLLKQLFELINLLNSETGTNQIAAGFALGLVLGFAPAFSLQTVLVILLLLIFRVQIGAALVAAFFFGLVAWLLDPVHDLIGRAVLETELLAPLFTAMYNLPLIPLTRFYNSITMGAMALSLLLAPLVFLLSRVLVRKYRETVVVWLKKTRLYKALESTTFFKWYLKFKEMYA